MELKTMSELEFLTYALLGVNIEIKIICGEFLNRDASQILQDSIFTSLARRNELIFKLNELLKQNSQEELS